MADYKGRISNKGIQKVEAPFKTTSGKSPKVVSGGDLRAKPSKK